jgi:tRNA threonylcarbamoyl adenosine modification protein (Sua5/YciO/YrdC/YwlC family)
MSNAIFLKIHPDNPPLNKILHVVDVLQKGGIIIYPTDTIYGMGCDLHNARAVEKLCALKGIKPDKANLSFICSDLTHISDYAKSISTGTYKVMKRALPGPFTFILEASSKVPRVGGGKKKTVGIRVPNHQIPLQIVRELGHPIISTSIRDEDEIVEYSTDPGLIYEKFKHTVDLVIDGGYGQNIPSTVVDCQNGLCDVLRQGAGDIGEYV